VSGIVYAALDAATADEVVAAVASAFRLHLDAAAA
jgi:hypothetical protein